MIETKRNNLVKIIGIGSTIGSTKITNTELAERIGFSEDRIIEKTGITARYHCAPGKENLYVLMASAIEKALFDSGYEIETINESIDGLFTTCNPTGPFSLPNTTSIVASLLGLNNFYNWSGGSGCIGGLQAIESAYNKLVVDSLNNKESTYIVCAGDQTSNMVDGFDEIFFSDSASALILTNKKEITENNYYSIDFVNLLTNQEKAQALYLRRGQMVNHDAKGVLKFATGFAPKAILSLLNETTFPKCDYLIPHQANLRILESIQKTFFLDDDSIYKKDVVTIGNTSSASTLIALENVIKSKITDRNIILGAFGEGLSVAVAKLIKNKDCSKNIIDYLDSNKLHEKYNSIYQQKWGCLE